jgi:hypothetical protein
VVLKEFLTPETKKEFHLRLADYFKLEEADKMPIQLETILLKFTSTTTRIFKTCNREIKLQKLKKIPT